MNSTLKLLTELRKRLLFSLGVFSILFSIGFLFSDSLFHIYTYPLLRFLPKPHHLIATHITSPIVTPLILAMNFAYFSTTPYVLWHIWQFVAPALYRNERRNLRYLLSGSLGLFSLGSLFCYFFILPFMFQCFVRAVPKEVTLLPDISSVIQFITEMLVIFGCSFQIPLLFLLVTQLGILDVSQCQALRPYAIVTAFILGMLLTPPDVTAQILLALPLWGLFELGIILAHALTKTIR